MLSDIQRGWNKNPTLKGRAALIRDETLWHYAENSGKIKVGAALLVAGTLVLSSHFHTSAAAEAVTAEMTRRTGEVVIKTDGVERHGVIRAGHAQMVNDDYPEANDALRAFSGAACKTVTLKVESGRLHLPVWQHVGSSEVSVSTFDQPGFNRDAYACIPTAK